VSLRTTLKPLDRRHAAVLAIDFQDEYRTGAAWPVAGYEEILRNARRLLDAARASAIPVLHVQAWSAEDSPYTRLMAENTPPAARSGIAGSGGAAICPEVAPFPGEYVAHKTFPSGFRGTGLAAELQGRKIQELIALGVWTEACLRETAFDALYQGHRIWLVKDACGSGTQAMHRAGMLDLANRLYGGGVLSTPNALRWLTGEPAKGWHFTRPVEFAYERETLDAMYEAL
jgi:maleamate amidohydrolase